MSEETEFLPWRILINRLGYIIEQLDTTKVYGNFQNYMIELIQPLYDSLGWEDKQEDSWLQRQLRTAVISFACSRGINHCVSKAKSYYSQWMANENSNL